MTGFETASLVVASANATAAIVAAVGIWYGIHAMVRAARERARTLDQQREADDKRHAETMAALQTAFREMREADDKRHAETMTALQTASRETREADDKRHTETMTALQELMRR